MALEFLDSFDHYSASSFPDLTHHPKYRSLPPGGGTRTGIQTWSSGATIDATGGRTGQGLSLPVQTDYVKRLLATAKATLITGAWYRTSNAAFINASHYLISIGVVTEEQRVAVEVTNTGQLKIYVGGTLRATSTRAYVVRPNNFWQYIEVKAFAHTSSGTVSVRVNGVERVSWTGNTGSGSFSRAILGLSPAGSNAHNDFWDSWYVADGDGSVNNTFLGPIDVHTLYPDGAGTYTEWTPSTGSNYDCVNETLGDSSDYVELVTPVGSALRDSYNFDYSGAIDTSKDIYGVQQSFWGLVISGTVLDLRRIVRRSGTEVTTSTNNGQYVTTDHAMPAYIHETDPIASAAWTHSNLAGTEFGQTHLQTGFTTTLRTYQHVVEVAVETDAAPFTGLPFAGDYAQVIG